MGVFQNRSYERHMVSNIPTLLAAGNTLADLGVGQIGIFDAKTNLSVTAPTYAVNKAIYIAQGTPDRSNFTEGAGVPNVYRKSHTIAGKKIQNLYAKKANKRQVEIVTLGNTGIPGDTKTLTAKPGETFYYWVRLTGDPIFNLNPDRSKGIILQGAVQMPCADDCSDNCGTVDCNTITNLVVADFNTKQLVGGTNVTKYVKAGEVLNCSSPASLTEVPFYKHSIVIPSCGKNGSLGAVQAQAPGFTVTNEGTVDGFTTYSVVAGLDATGGCIVPEDFVLNAGSIATNCDTCPAGWSAVDSTDEFQVRAEGAEDIAATIEAALPGGSVVTLINSDPQVNISTYSVLTALGTETVATIETALVGVIVLGSTSFVGVSTGYCTNDAPTTYAYSNEDCSEVFCNKVEVEFELFIKDDLCGNDLLTELEAAYASLGTVELIPDASGDCGHGYKLTTVSANCVELGCAPESVVFPVVPDFRGVAWVEVPLAVSTSCYCGIQFESVYVPRVTKEATFDQFAYQTDFVHIEVSSHNPDWRSTDLCETDPIATRVQGGSYENGAGQAVARLEKADRMYDMDYFYMSPVLREAFDFYFETKFDQYYDQVGIEYDFSYSSNNGFGQTDTDRYIQNIWLPETQAGALVAALNGYVASASIAVDPIVL